MHIELKQTIETLFPTYFDFWKTICTMETPSVAREALNLQADVIEKFSKERGFSVTRQSHPKAGDTMTITLFGYADQAPVALLAHMDTVHAPGAFGCPIVREKDGILYGPGVFDCKGGIVAAFLAMDAIDRCGFRDRPVRLILQSDEEGGAILVVAAGDARIDNRKFKEQFALKAKMLSHEEVEPLVGHDVGGVCPFAVNEGVKTYLDVSLKRFETVFPACGSSNSAIELTIPELEKYSGCMEWIDVCKGWNEEAQA